MFKSRKKRQQEKEAQLLKAKANNEKSEIAEIETSKYKLLDDIHLTHDFRSSIILPELNRDLDPSKLSKQQLHLAKLRDIPESPTMLSTPPLSPPLTQLDGTKQYQELAAWRHQRSQNRYSNGLFGGKQRGRPKPNQNRKYHDHDIEEDEEPEQQVSVTTTTTTNNELNTQSILQQLHQQHDEEEDDDYELSDKEEEEDEELIEELYEPNSDTEENYFFQDFSNSNSNKPVKKSTRNNNRRKSNKAMINKFDLSSFARDLHDHRLSVVQRESRIIMTEDDELELEKLLERQRQRMSMMTIVSESTESLVPLPPMPSLDLIKSHQESTVTIYRPISPTPTPAPKQIDIPILNSSTSTTTVTTDTSSSIEDDVSQEFITPKPVTSISSASTTPKIDQLKRSVSTTSIKSSFNKPIPRSNLTPIRDNNARKSISMDNLRINLKENEHSVTSAALDWISENDHHHENNIKSLHPTSDPTSLSYKQTSTPSPPPVPQLSKSRSLFGSLRQVSRSKSHHHSGNGGGGIKGLVRNFSSSHHKPSSTISSNDAAGMSRAAMAVIQHNVAKQEKKKSTITPLIPEEESSAVEPTIPAKPPKRRSRSKSDANNNNLISHLISRASSSRKQSTTKIVNMEDDATVAAKKRAQVVRRTIIYVQPDSLHNLLKNGGDGSSIKVPPMPPKINTRNTMASDGSLSPDDETIRSREYVTATKIVRQTSVRKRIVEDTTDSKSSSSPLSESSTLLERQGSNNRKRYQLKSVDEHDLLSKSKHSSSSTSSSNNSDYMEGVELREMSDGSVVWGLVKKQGNRKSFYAPNNEQGYEHVDDEEDDTMYRKQQMQQQQQYLSNNLSPPPIPKRSPRRQPTTTDVYYSNQVTLPNLIKMMQDQQQQQHPGDDDEEDDYDDFNERAMSSVDDQLDEMMRILTSQQQH